MRTQSRLLTNRLRFCLALLLASSVVVVTAPGAGKSAGAATAQRRKGVVIFAVSGEAGEGSMDAVCLGGQVRALATSSAALGKRASARRAPTDAERTGVMTLVKSIYAQHKTPASLIASIKVTNLTATDLNGDGQYEFIGSFTSAAGNKFERDLFLIAKPQSAGMRADFAEFQAYQPPPETFLHSIDFIDQLDLDGDGMGEVFAVQGGFDGCAYVIFKKVGGRWRQVYDVMGDAC